MIKNDLIRILLFVGICFSMASCAALQKEERLGEREKSESEFSKNADAQIRKNIVREAEKYVGAKYKYAGESPRGFDCSGFTQYVVSKFDIPLSRTSQSQEKDGKPISVVQARPGDLVFFRRTKGGSVFHVGLVVSNNRDGITIIHSTSSRGVVVDKIAENSYWRTKIASFRDVVGHK
jgi:cell wall-associated NlpC family hydrolase